MKMQDYENLKKKYEDLKEFIYSSHESSQSRINEIKTVLTEINKKYNEEVEKNKKLEEENKKLSGNYDLLDRLEDKIFSIEKQKDLSIEPLPSNCIKENYALLEKELSEKEKILEEKEKELKSMKDEIQKLKNENNQQKQKIESLEKYEKENISIKDEKDKLTSIIKQTETKSDFLQIPAEEYYDVVIDICSINSLKNEGWPIKYNKERKEIYQKIIGEQTIKIGAIGLNNVGKSYLLSKIVGAKIPTGYRVETKGISIKYSQGDKGEEEGICILDSVGLETPLLKEKKNNENNEIEKEKIEKEEENKDKLENIIKFDEIEDLLSRDKVQTERFIEQLIYSLSDMIILVVGKLTRTEQKLITRVKNLAKMNEKNKKNQL